MIFAQLPCDDPAPSTGSFSCSLCKYLVSAHYVLGDGETDMNKADIVPALVELMIYWEKWAINRYLNKSGTVDAVIGIPTRG